MEQLSSLACFYNAVELVGVRMRVKLNGGPRVVARIGLRAQCHTNNQEPQSLNNDILLIFLSNQTKCTEKLALCDSIMSSKYIYFVYSCFLAICITIFDIIMLENVMRQSMPQAIRDLGQWLLSHLIQQYCTTKIIPVNKNIWNSLSKHFNGVK